MTQKAKTSRYSQGDYQKDEKIFREEVYPRIQELIRTNDWDTGTDWKESDRKWKRQDQLMEELQKHAYDARCMSGRIVRFQCADSHAVYVVTKVWKTKATLQWIDYGDGWDDSRLGEKGSLDLDYVHGDICRQDQMSILFERKAVS